jgi:lipoate-protein ligase B
VPADVVHRHLGRIRYREALALQQLIHESVVQGVLPEHVLTLEHEPVITLGRRGSFDDLLADRSVLDARGIDVVVTDRGGEVTWHGPGQLVVYAIVDARARGLGPSDLVRRLAGAVSTELALHGVEATWEPAHPGLWVGGAKIAAVGMRVTRGVSLHGVAVNLTTPLDAFTLFVPCGMPGAQATSIAALGVTPPDLAGLGARVAARFVAELSQRAPG